MSRKIFSSNWFILLKIRWNFYALLIILKQISKFHNLNRILKSSLSSRVYLYCVLGWYGSNIFLFFLVFFNIISPVVPFVIMVNACDSALGYSYLCLSFPRWRPVFNICKVSNQPWAGYYTQYELRSRSNISYLLFINAKDLYTRLKQ